MNWIATLPPSVLITALIVILVIATYGAIIGGIAIWRKGKIKFGKFEIDGDDEPETKTDDKVSQ